MEDPERGSAAREEKSDGTTERQAHAYDMPAANRQTPNCNKDQDEDGTPPRRTRTTQRPTREARPGPRRPRHRSRRTATRHRLKDSGLRGEVNPRKERENGYSRHGNVKRQCPCRGSRAAGKPHRDVVGRGERTRRRAICRASPPAREGTQQKGGKHG